jgi:hypothetical protein
MIYNENYDYLIGADGINSFVREEIGIKYDDAIINTNYMLSMCTINPLSKLNIKNDVIQYISQEDNRMIKDPCDEQNPISSRQGEKISDFHRDRMVKRTRIFIKPNGNISTNMQIVFHKDKNPIIPEQISNEIISYDHTTVLRTGKIFIPPYGRIILIGDALHPMIPYHGNGANTAMNDCKVITHLLLEPNHNNLSKNYYDITLAKSFKHMNDFYNTFLELHEGNNNVNKNKYLVMSYDSELSFNIKKPSYLNNDGVVKMLYNKNNKLRDLLMCGNKIEKFPINLIHISDIRILNLNDNNISIIPPEIELMTSLSELFLRNNKITIFDKALLKLKFL